MDRDQTSPIQKAFRLAAAAVVLACLPQKTEKSLAPSLRRSPPEPITMSSVALSPIVPMKVSTTEFFDLKVRDPVRPIILPNVPPSHPTSKARAEIPAQGFVSEIKASPTGLRTLMEHVHISFAEGESAATNSNVDSFLLAGNFTEAMSPLTLNKTGHYRVTKLDVDLSDTTSFSLHYGGNKDSNYYAAGVAGLPRPRYTSRYQATAVGDAAFLGADSLRDTLAMSKSGGALSGNFLASVTRKFDLDEWHMSATALVITRGNSDKLLHSGMDFQNRRLVGGLSFDSEHGTYVGVAAVTENIGYDLVKNGGMGLRLQAEHIHYLGQEPFLPRDTSRIALLLRHEF